MIGFDSRIGFSELQSSWSSGNRDAYLIRKDAPYPCSVDDEFWPSTVDVTNIRKEGILPGCVQNLWDSLELLDDYVMNCGLPKYTDRVRIAVSVKSNDVFRRHGTLWADAFALPKEPQRPPAHWKIIGFDVADRYLMSGPLNIGMTCPDTLLRMQRALQGGVNDYHLFTTDAYAECCADIANSSIPEHSPFFVYCMWADTTR